MSDILQIQRRSIVFSAFFHAFPKDLHDFLLVFFLSLQYNKCNRVYKEVTHKGDVCVAKHCPANRCKSPDENLH